MEKLSVTITLNDASRVFRIVYVPQEPSQACGTKERSAHREKKPTWCPSVGPQLGPFRPSEDIDNGDIPHITLRVCVLLGLEDKHPARHGSP